MPPTPIDRPLHAIHARAAAAALALATASMAGAEVVWTTNPNIPTVYSTFLLGPSVESPVLHGEVADDFNVNGTIEQILADGETCNNGCFSTPDGVTGVWVRFYEWTPDGPGALQSEQYVPHQGGFGWTPVCCMELLHITLPTPFVATGLHFVSVQVELSGTAYEDQWNFYGLNHNATMASPAYYRDFDAGGIWMEAGPAMGFVNVDMSFQLSGTILQPPSADMLFLDPADGTVNPSSRVVVTGIGFGDGSNAALVIGGVPAIISAWDDETIVAYVPEAAAPGSAEVALVIDGTTVDTLPLTIAPRTPNGRVKWVFEGDAPLSYTRSAVGPDGTLYSEDQRAKLYAIGPDGGLLWLVDALLGQQGLGNEGPVVVGDDGTIYVATNPLGITVELVAFNPDGTHKWTYTVPKAVTWQAGPAIGPDGNIYGALNAGTLVGNAYDVFSIRPDGTKAWAVPANPGIFEDAAHSQEILFLPGTPGGPIDQMVFTSDQNGGGYNWGFALSNGAQRFNAPICTGNDVGQGQLAGDPASGAFYMMEFACGSAGWGLQSFDADGDRSWRFDPGIASLASHPAVDGDGALYFSWDLLRITSVDPSGGERWTVVTNDVWYDDPIPSPTAPMLVIRGMPTDAPPSSFIEARRTSDGSLLWSQELVDAQGNQVGGGSKPMFAPDGDVVYFSATELPITTVSTYRIFAVDTADLAGDANADGVVDFADLLAVIVDWGTDGSQNGGDLDGNGVVDFADLVLVLVNWTA